MKSSASRTTGNGGVYPNYTILFLLLLVVGDLGIQTNSRVMAGSILSRKNGTETEELRKDVNAEFAKRTLSLVNSILECYELLNKAADTGMNSSVWTIFENLKYKMGNEFKSINESFTESKNSKMLDSKMEKIYRTALANYNKLKDKFRERDAFQQYEPLEPENMQINATSFESSGWWKKMSKTKKIALITSIAGIALLTGSISAYFGIRHSMSSDQVDEPKPATDLSMKQIKQPVDNERLVTKKDKPKSGGTAMLVVVLLIALAIGLSLVTYLCFKHHRNQVDANAPSRPNNKSEGSASTTITTKDPHHKGSKKNKKKQTKSPKSNGEPKSNSSSTN